MSLVVAPSRLVSAAISLASEPHEVWIVRWVTLDFTRRPFWCGPTRTQGDAAHDEMWSADRRDAWPFASREEALWDPDLVLRGGK